MHISSKQAWAMATAAIAMAAAPLLSSQEPEQVKFATPVRIKAGDAFLGAGRLYPSPVLHDVDGDGQADVVVGDLIGNVTRALRSKDAKSLALAAEEPLPDRDGKPLKFHNW